MKERQGHPTFTFLFTLSLALALVVLFASPASAQTETVLYDFTTGDGAVYPAGNLIMDSSGNLYGVSQSDTEGAVYELIPSSGGTWTLKILYEFKDLSDGIPADDLVMDSAGNLYGTCIYGGTSYYGTVYELKRISNGTWRKQVLHNFVNDGKDGNYPGAALIFDKAGNLYGTTQEGGLKNVGVVFELTPYAGGSGWNEKILYSFPYKQKLWNALNFPLVLDSAGSLYGVSDQGDNGAYVFKLSPTSKGRWTLTTLYTFGASSGPAPSAPFAGVVFDSAGNLYGDTVLGGAEGSGTVYQLSPSADGTWTERNLFDFPSSCSPACGPHTGVTVDAAGNIFGTASASVTGTEGAVYELSPDGNGTWNLSILHYFSGGDDGADPSVGPLLNVSGNLYGTTRAGGGTKGRGVVYEITP